MKYLFLMLMPIIIFADAYAPKLQRRRAVPNVTVTRWVSPDGSQPLKFKEWNAKQSKTKAWQIKPIYLPENKLDTRVDILVEDSLVSYLTSNLDTLVADLVLESYAPAVYSVSGSSPESLRNFLISEYRAGMVSTVLIGDLPVAWFQMIDDWNNNGIRDPGEGYEEFPCELYFMDLDGSWEDNYMQYDTLDSMVPGTDNVFDTHIGNLMPEISISRMPVSVIGFPVQTLQFYFNKNHRYRNAQLPVCDRALVYVDDDWIPHSYGWDQDVGMVYSDRVFIWDAEQTRAIDYRPRIDSAAYQWIGLFAHSWPGGHGWKYNNGQLWDWFWADEIPSINPIAVFYNLFACSNARFVENGFCGGRYVFNTSTGLASIGSAKTGSMLEFQDFYGQLALGKTLGESFREWFGARISDGFEPWEKSWFYGMCLIGDGLLKTHTPIDVGVSSIIAPPIRVDSGSVVTPQVKVKNFGNAAVDFSIVLRIGTGYEDIKDVNGLSSGDTAIVNFFPWTARPLGTQVIRCTTLLAGDVNAFNDLFIDSVIVVPGPGIADDETRNVSGKFGLENIFPNPFISRTIISFAISKESRVDLVIYNASGKLVRSLKSEILKAGSYRVTWDGKDNQGIDVMSGIYFYTIKTEGYKTIKKLVLMR
ncbi:MAG: T9SS type A sorting domain-containing protein [candidate division WOR-3 bacterium]|nr:T9SS type A sorting domain-containing protein [candidate division WOR-3 bacterium]